MNRRNYYDILEIPMDANFDDVRNAYKRLAIKYHPDRTKDPKANEKFSEIQQAYEVLGNYRKRREYDDQLEGNRQISPFGSSTLQPFDPFGSSLFGNAFNDPFFQNPMKHFEDMNRKFENMRMQMPQNAQSYSYSSSTVFRNGEEETNVQRSTMKDGKTQSSREYIKKKDGKIIDRKVYDDGNMLQDDKKQIGYNQEGGNKQKKKHFWNF